MSEQQQVIITTNTKILSVLNASQVQRQEHGALLFNNIVMEELVQPWKTQQGVRSTTTAIASCLRGHPGQFAAMAAEADSPPEHAE